MAGTNYSLNVAHRVHDTRRQEKDDGDGVSRRLSTISFSRGNL
jgi:hypothetical protein